MTDRIAPRTTRWTGDTIRRRREALGWSQERLAFELGLKHRNSVAQLEQGDKQVTPVIEMAIRWIEQHHGMGGDA